MPDTIEALFLKAYDADMSIIDDDTTLSTPFKQLLSENDVTPDDERLRFVFPTVEDEGETVVNEHCSSARIIFAVGERLFSLMWLDNRYEQYAGELEEVVAVDKTITVYTKL